MRLLSEMDKVKDVVIDSDGVFKYILIELTEKKKARSSSGGNSGSSDDHQQPRKKTVVRGFEWAEFHGEHYICTRPGFNMVSLCVPASWVCGPRAGIMGACAMGQYHGCMFHGREDLIAGLQCIRLCDA